MLVTRNLTWTLPHVEKAYREWYSVGRYVYVPLALVLCCVALFMNVSF